MSDSISRTGISAWLDNMGYTKLADAVMDKDRFPSADRPTGEWQKEIKGNGWSEWAVLTCDRCGAIIENPTFETNYCPNCGAKMGGEGE